MRCLAFAPQLLMLCQDYASRRARRSRSRSRVYSTHRGLCLHRIVRISLSSSPSHWSLTIEDNGKGFLGKEPMIIKERVDSIAGELTVESNPGLGARLEIKVPRDGEVSDEF